MRFSCNLNGTCEEDFDEGIYLTRQQCQASCQSLGEGADTREAAYLAMSFNLEQALNAAPSDRVNLIRRITGVTVTADDSWDTLASIITDDYLELYRREGNIFLLYLEARLDEFDFLLLELISPRYTSISPNWSKIRLIITSDIRQLFQGYHDIYFFVELQEEPPPSLAELISALQLQIALIILETFDLPQDPANHHNYVGEVSQHWPYLLEQFGPTIPYQEMIGIDR